jgi:hypothetical protein
VDTRDFRFEILHVDNVLWWWSWDQQDVINAYVYKIFLSHSALPIQATPDYHKRSMLRFKPYPPPRSTHSTSSQDLPGMDCYLSLNSGLASQPPCGTTSTPVKQQATETTMDIWWATLRMRRWTPPSPPPTNVRTLAHRKRCFHVFWLLIMDKKKFLQFGISRPALFRLKDSS